MAGAVGVAFAAASPAHAALPVPLRAVLDAAMAKGDEKDIAVVARYVKAASPADAAEVDALVKAHDERVRLAKARAEETSPTGKWRGKGQLGLTQSTGNTTSLGANAGFNVNYRRERLTVKFSGQFNYQRSDGRTTQNSLTLAAEPKYRIAPHTFVFGLTQYDRDRFQGYAERETFSAGVGHTVRFAEGMKADLKVAPAWRSTRFTDGDVAYRASGLASVDYRWKFSPRLGLEETATVVSDPDNTTLTSLTAIDARLDDWLSARLSYRLNHESNPGTGLRSTDTVTAVSLVFGL